MNEVNLTSTPADTWSKILDYMYTAEILITSENVKDIIWVANRFQMDPLCKKCAQFLTTRLAPENVINVRKFADWLGFIEMKSVASTMLIDQFETVINQDEFLSITCPELIEILQIEFLRVRSEFVILYAALRWIQSDLGNRTEDAVRILKHIHLESFSDQAYVQRLVNKLPVELASPECCEKFLDEICERRSKRRMARRFNSDESSNHETPLPRYSCCCLRTATLWKDSDTFGHFSYCPMYILIYTDSNFCFIAQHSRLRKGFLTYKLQVFPSHISLCGWRQE